MQFAKAQRSGGAGFGKGGPTGGPGGAKGFMAGGGLLVTLAVGAFAINQSIFNGAYPYGNGAKIEAYRMLHSGF